MREMGHLAKTFEECSNKWSFLWFSVSMLRFLCFNVFLRRWYWKPGDYRSDSSQVKLGSAKLVQLKGHDCPTAERCSMATGARWSEFDNVLGQSWHWRYDVNIKFSKFSLSTTVLTEVTQLFRHPENIKEKLCQCGVKTGQMWQTGEVSLK